MSDNSRQDSATTAAHRKRIIGILTKSKCLGAVISDIWENIYGYDEYYGCAIELYLL